MTKRLNNDFDKQSLTLRTSRADSAEVLIMFAVEVPRMLDRMSLRYCFSWGDITGRLEAAMSLLEREGQQKDVVVKTMHSVL